MQLYLVQHAVAKSKQDDPERSLSEQGLADISQVAAYVSDYASPHQIVHSGKLRAKQTAEVLAEALTPADGLAISADLSPMADTSIWAERLAEMHLEVMLVGHLPHLSKLAALLICQDEAKKVISFQNAAVVCLHRDEAGGWSVLWVVTPQITA